MSKSKRYFMEECTNKQTELDNVWAELKGMQAKYEKVVADKQAEIAKLSKFSHQQATDLDFQQEDLAKLKAEIDEKRSEIQFLEDQLGYENEWKNKYEELKARADKMHEALGQTLARIPHSPRAEAFIIEALLEYESIDKGNTK